MRLLTWFLLHPKGFIWKGVQEELEREVPSMSVPSLDTAGPSSVPAAEKGVDPTQGGASNGVVSRGGFG